MRKLIENLTRKLSEPLPGKKAQLLMAPAFRPDVEAGKDGRKAGVIILLYPHQNKIWSVLTKRQVYEGNHSGQVSFPGGKVEPEDTSLISTALREAEEEIGVNQNMIEILGSLTPLYIPVSGIEVYPVVGYIDYRPDFNPDPHEVDFLIEFPFHLLFEPGIKDTEIYESGNRKGIIPFYNISGNHVWGATAMILSELIEILTADISEAGARF